jgi:CDP-Glycerol:Poly(glycerophosphate) glycerophosphotransferase
LNVFISIPSGVSAGNILRGGLADRLLEANQAVDVVIVSPLVRDPAFVQEFKRPRVTFEDLPPHTPAGLEGRLMALIQAGYLDSGVSESVKIRRDEAIAKKSIRWISAKRLLAGIVAPSILRRTTRYAVIDRMISHPGAEQLFEKYRPVLLVGSSPGLIFSEVPILRTAARRGVRTIVVDPSWDNFTNKLIPVRRADRLVVWNDIMKQQAVDLHGYAPDQVRVSGPPHWDRYFRPGPVVSRDAFFARIGADPARRLVTLMTTGKTLYDHYPRVVRILMNAIHSGRWGAAQLLVRLHPRDDLDRYDEFKGTPQMIVEKPFKKTVKSGDGLDVDITAENQQHLADTLRHSDVVVTVASTIAIEASIFDTPVVDISFDGEAPVEFAKSARRYYQFTHYANITRQGAAPVADTPEALVEHVGRYLADRTLDRDGRRRVVQDQCQFTDGRSTERIGKFVVEELADVVGGPERVRATA